MKNQREYHSKCSEEDMFEFLSQNQMYIVLLVTLIIWAGIVWYLIRLDKKINKLEKQVKKD